MSGIRHFVVEIVFRAYKLAGRKGLAMVECKLRRFGLDNNALSEEGRDEGAAETMNPPSLIKRLLASAFVLMGGIAIVLVIWPEEIANLEPEHVTAAAVARAIGAVAAAAIGLMVLLTLWDDDFR